MRGRIYCAVFGCMNSTLTHPEITFFKLPANPERRLEWLLLIRREDLENKSSFTSYRVCENHFKFEDILKSTNRKLLKKNTVPSLVLPNLATTTPGVFRNIDKQTQTDPLEINEHCTQTENLTHETFTQTSRRAPRKRKLKVGLPECVKEIKLIEAENIIQEIENKTQETENKTQETENKTQETENKTQETVIETQKTENKTQEIKNETQKSENETQEIKNATQETENETRESKENSLLVGRYSVLYPI